ncbi:MAG: tyrosine-type recombinase/integrase [Planctomycetes bacterium]|nr:tyrosine-type recombinase/integrase [Planctomycetota bacterium]
MVVVEAGFPYARIHDLRGTFCTRAVRAGIDPKTVQTLVGHSDIMTTLRYYTAASTARTNREAIEAMAAAG